MLIAVQGQRKLPTEKWNGPRSKPDCRMRVSRPTDIGDDASMNKDIAREGYYLGPPVPPHTDVRHKQDSRASEEGDVCQVKQGNCQFFCST